MSEIGFGQLVASNFWLIVVVTTAVVVTVIAGVVRRRRRVRQMPATVDGVRFECQDVRVVDDMIIEQEWQVTFLLTNVTRRPVLVPALNARGVLRVGRLWNAGAVVVESAAIELNPDDLVVAWLACRLPAGSVPDGGAIAVGRDEGELSLSFHLHLPRIPRTRGVVRSPRAREDAEESR